jgi:hypothetical protein
MLYAAGNLYHRDCGVILHSVNLINVLVHVASVRLPSIFGKMEISLILAAVSL